MKTTVTRTLLLLALAASPALFTGCNDKEPVAPAPPVDPKAVFKLSRSFFYPRTQTSHDLVHSPATIAGESAAYPLVVSLDIKTTTDALHLELDRAKLGNTWLGTYALQTPSQPGNPAFVSYSYTMGNNSPRIFRFSNTTAALTGRVSITAFDAKRQLVSGSYELTAPGQADPMETQFNDKCDITLTGEFNDVKVKGN